MQEKEHGDLSLLLHSCNFHNIITILVEFYKFLNSCRFCQLVTDCFEVGNHY